MTIPSQIHRRKSFTAGPVASVDSITTTSMNGLSGGLSALNPGYFVMEAIDDDRVLIIYLQVTTNAYFCVVGDRGGGTTYTFGTPVAIGGAGGSLAAGYSDGAFITISYNTDFQVHTIAGSVISASVGSGTLTNRETNAGGAAMMLMDGETDKFFCVQQKRTNPYNIYGQIIDITTPSSPSVGTEVLLVAGTAVPPYYVLAMSRVDGNRFVVANNGGSGSLRLFIVDADPGHSHTTGAVYTPTSNTSGLTYAVHALSSTRGVCYFRSGASGVNGNLQLFAIDSGTKVITAVDTDTPPAGTNVDSRADIRAGANPDEFIFTRSSGGTVETSIYSIAGDVLTELDTLSLGSISTYQWASGPAGCAQGNNVAYLSGKSTTGLHFIQSYGG